MPKNRKDHAEFNMSWTAKIDMPILTIFFFKPSFHTIYKEIPIRKYKETHTGPKIQPGGLNEGFCKITYHVWTEEDVNIDPIIPANWQIIMETKNRMMFFIFILFLDANQFNRLLALHYPHIFNYFKFMFFSFFF